MDETQAEPRRVMVVLPASMAVASLRAAHAEGISRSELVRRLLAGHLAETEH